MSKVDLQVEHVLSVEKDPKKLQYILQAHTSVKHVFDDVVVFERGMGYCYKCKQTHGLDDIDVDILACGPSCKDLSKRNSKPNQKCYEDQQLLCIYKARREGRAHHSFIHIYIYIYKGLAGRVRHEDSTVYRTWALVVLFLKGFLYIYIYIV